MASFKDYKDSVSLMQVALAVGFTINKRAGLVNKTPEMIRYNGQTKESIVLTDNKKGWFTHGGEKGDLISFVRKYAAELEKNVPAISATDNITVKMNKILAHFSNGVEKLDEKKYMAQQGMRNAVPFDTSRYLIEKVSSATPGLMNIFRQRGIEAETVDTFAPFLRRSTDKEGTMKIKNLAFPYTVPGNDKVVGMEIRGFGGFKQKAAGSDSSNALWIADFTKGKPEEAKRIIFVEGAFDAMAYYQANKKDIDLKTTVFASTGGSFSYNQVYNMLKYFPAAKPVDAFDNDLNGRIYGVRLLNITENSKNPDKARLINIVTMPDRQTVKMTYGKTELQLRENEITITKIRKAFSFTHNIGVHKAPPQYKDWNDAIRNITKEMAAEAKGQKKTKRIHNAELKDKPKKIFAR